MQGENRDILVCTLIILISKDEKVLAYDFSYALIQGPRSDLKVEGLSCERSEQNGGPRARSGKRLRPRPLKRQKTPFDEYKRPLYCQFAVEKKSILTQVDCIR